MGHDDELLGRRLLSNPLEFLGDDDAVDLNRAASVVRRDAFGSYASIEQTSERLDVRAWVEVRPETTDKDEHVIFGALGPVVQRIARFDFMHKSFKLSRTIAFQRKVESIRCKTKDDGKGDAIYQDVRRLSQEIGSRFWTTVQPAYVGLDLGRLIVQSTLDDVLEEDRQRIEGNMTL